MDHDREVEREAPRPPVAAPRTPVAPLSLPAGVSNAAVARAAAGTGMGAGLPSNAHGALRALGAQAADVRVHTGPAADARLARRPGALAMTEGSDIHVGSSAPALDSPGGRLLLAHEAVHVAQQRVAGPAVSREAAEAQADAAAVAVSLGGPLPALSAATGPLYFEARWHQASLTGALDELGFTDAEQEQAYFANWCRDLSQAFVPMARDSVGPAGAFQLVNLLAMHHFGHGVTPAQLGAYNPAEHIDNPAGTTDRDVMGGGVTISGYGADGTAAGPDAAQLSPAEIANSFAVSATGVPEYIERSRRYIETEAQAATVAGRTPEGLFHAGNFSHTCEDLFAHSNWIEIAVGRVLSEDPGLLPAGDTRDEVRERLAAGRPPVENFAADVRDRAGEARPILSTGTFSGGGAGNDTLISIKAEAQNLLRDREPFKEDGGGGEMYDFAIEVLRNADASAEEGSLGPIFTEVVEQALGNLGSLATGVIAGLPGTARETLGDGVLGDLAVGAAELLNEGAAEVSDAAGEVWQAGLREAVSSAANTLGPVISLAEIAVYLKGGASSIADAWKALKDGVRELPAAIVAIVLPRLVAAEREFKSRLRALGNAAYGRAVELLVDALEGIAPVTDAAETNVEVKRQHWQEDLERLRGEMAAMLEEVGGTDGAELAGRVRAMGTEETIGFAHSAAFEAVIAALVDDIATRVRLQAAASSLDDRANQVAQLDNVPAWARAGASHSQTAKDHDDSVFFGLAFTVARQADGMLLSELTAAWERAGYIGPADGLEDDFGAEPTGNAAEDARRAAFRETREAGAGVLEHGHAETQDIGPRLVALAEGLETIIEEHPVLDPVLSGLAWALRHNDDMAALEAELQATRARWEAAARSGEFDDAVMAAVDQALGQIARLAGTQADLHHPLPSDDHDHGDRSEVAYQSQLDALQSHRGAAAVAPDAGVGMDRLEPAMEPLTETIRTVFDHPYESDWWRGTVRSWCEQHGEQLERAVHDRNAGVMHSHAH